MTARTNRKYTAGFVICSLTGAKIPYNGVGRPPKYSPEARAQLNRDRSKARRAAAKLAAA